MSVAPSSNGKLARKLVDEIHDQLQVTDRVWHHIDYTKPLVVELIGELVETQPAPARVLLIGADSLLAYATYELGYQTDLWHFADGYLTDDLQDRVAHSVALKQLAAGDLPFEGETYDAILVPLVLESLDGDPRVFLSQLRSGLSKDGSLLLATANVSRLDLRLLHFTGQSTAHAYPKFHVSFSFPPLPRQRYYHLSELRDLARKAGFWLHEARYIRSHIAYSDIDPHPPGRFLKLNLNHSLTGLLPATRPTLLMRLSHRVGDAPAQSAGGTPRHISVILSSRRDREHLHSAMTALLGQDYPADFYEVIVLHDGSNPERSAWINEVTNGRSVRVRELVLDPAEGPAARNAAMVASSGEICAHTDDACRIPLGWLPTIAGTFRDSDAVISGPVLDEPGSHPPFLTFPGSRPGWEQQGLFPISNVAYRRSAVLADGGFWEPNGAGKRAPLLWDTELAWRIQRMGWEGQYLKHMFTFRSYPPPKRLGWLRAQWKFAYDLPAMVRRVPEVRKELLTAGIFASATTLYFDLLLIGLIGAAATRHWAPLALAGPWMFYYSRFVDLWPITQWRPSFRRVAGAAARHLIWVAGLIMGSFRARRLVL